MVKHQFCLETYGYKRRCQWSVLTSSSSQEQCRYCACCRGWKNKISVHVLSCSTCQFGTLDFHVINTCGVIKIQKEQQVLPRSVMK